MVDINTFKKDKKVAKPKLTITPTEDMKDEGDIGIQTTENKEVSLDNTSDSFSEEETNLTEEDILKYLEYFETLGITRAKVFEILDSILTKGEVNWAFTLLNKIPVVFRLRPSWVNDELLRILDETPPRTMVGFSEVIGKYNLAGSLKTYNKVGLNVTTKDELESALLYIGTLPYIIKAHLIKQLSIFDRVVAVATSDWALENFTLPQQEK